MEKKRRKVYPGFTLVELMVVLAIIGILTSIVTVNVFKAKDGASITAAKVSLESIRTSINMYQMNNQQYPKTLQELVDKKLIKNKLQDPWGEKFIYVPIYSDSGSSIVKYVLYSSGPDGTKDTPDDIGNPRFEATK